MPPYCPSCGKELKKRAKACLNCGKGLEEKVKAKEPEKVGTWEVVEVEEKGTTWPPQKKKLCWSVLVLLIVLAGGFLYTTYQNLDEILVSEMFQSGAEGVPFNQSCNESVDCTCTNEENIYCQMGLEWECLENKCTQKE